MILICHHELIGPVRDNHFEWQTHPPNQKVNLNPSTDDDDCDLLGPDLRPYHIRKDSEGVRGQPRPGVDSNVSAWSQLLFVVAVHTANSPGFCTPSYLVRLATHKETFPDRIPL